MNASLAIPAATLGSVVILGATLLAFAGDLPPEPGEEFLVDEDVNIITGLYTREYAMGLDGIVDYITSRQILQSEYGEFGETVVEAPALPLFYWYDANHDGHIDANTEMWIDRGGQGWPSDIAPYALSVEP